MKIISHSTLFLALAAGIGLATVASAQSYGSPHPQEHYAQETTRNATARVTRVERMAAQNDPYLRQECWDERNSRHEGDYYRDDSGRLYRNDGSGNKTARTLIGALIGGALGNQVGSGSGRTAATVAGAVVGGSIGNQSVRDDQRPGYDGYDRYRDDAGVEMRCRTVEGHARGGRNRDVYRVSYSYGGQTYRAMSYTHPGRTLRVTVDVRPTDDFLAGQR